MLHLIRPHIVVFKKVQESRLKWYGDVLRRGEEYVGKRVIVMEVPGKEG